MEQEQDAEQGPESEPELESEPEQEIEPNTSKEDFIATCTELKYKDIARNPDDYVGQNFYFTCTVSSVRQGTLFAGFQKYYITYEFDIDTVYDKMNDYGWSFEDAMYLGKNYDVCVWLLDNRSESDPDYMKILEDDIITVYGTFTGMTETSNSFTHETGEEVSLDIKYVELIHE